MSSKNSDQDLCSDHHNNLHSQNFDHDNHSVRSFETSSETHRPITSLHYYPEDVEEDTTNEPIDLADDLLLTYKSEEEKEYRVRENEESIKEVRSFASETSDNDTDFFKDRYVDDSNKFL